MGVLGKVVSWGSDERVGIGEGFTLVWTLPRPSAPSTQRILASIDQGEWERSSKRTIISSLQAFATQRLVRTNSDNRF